jgi:predicted flap endonuclease-1-like 5' DNA nuclease
LIDIIDIIIVSVIIIIAIKKSQPTTGEEEVEEVFGETELTEIKGIGAKRAKELNAVGVNTVSGLATASAKDLSQKTGISEKTISRWITEANKT